MNGLNSSLLFVGKVGPSSSKIYIYIYYIRHLNNVYKINGTPNITSFRPLVSRCIYTMSQNSTGFIQQPKIQYIFSSNLEEDKSYSLQSAIMLYYIYIYIYLFSFYSAPVPLQRLDNVAHWCIIKITHHFYLHKSLDQFWG